MASSHRHRARRSRSGWSYLGVAAAVVIAVAVSVWVVISPGPHDRDERAAADTGANSSPAVAAPRTTRETHTATPKPRPAPVQRWKYRDRCPDSATACVDLRDHVTWLQRGGVVFYGPVRMEPGSPGQETPPGVFSVAYKDKGHISNEFNEPMPNSVFFAPGGIAFHQGSLTKGSHGCVHLSWRDSAYYFDNLPVGAHVAVF